MCGLRRVVVRGPRQRRPVYCEGCTLEPGEAVVDREAGIPVVVVESTGKRANEVCIPERDWTVADHHSNRACDPENLVVAVLYPLDCGTSPADVSGRDLWRYSFQRCRLRSRN